MEDIAAQIRKTLETRSFTGSLKFDRGADGGVAQPVRHLVKSSAC